MDTISRRAHGMGVAEASDPVVIVGAGMAGLAAATLLAAAGRAVTIVEKDAGPGGKMAQVTIDGRDIDCGPTVLTLPDIFHDLPLSLPGLTRADILARHFWSGGATLDLFADEDRTTAAIATLSGEADAQGYREFTRAGATIYAALDESFMRADKPATPLSLMWRGGIGNLLGFTKLDPYRSLWAMVSQHFADPRLRQLFGRYTTYCGSSPFAAPATLALIAEVERRGVWLVEGGMHRLATTLLDAAVAHGATARFGVAVAEIVVETDARPVCSWPTDRASPQARCY